jgi:DnaK suppressor protein
MSKASAKKKPAKSAKPAAKKTTKKAAPAKAVKKPAPKKPVAKKPVKKAAPAKAPAKAATKKPAAKAVKKPVIKMAPPAKPLVKAKPRSSYKPAKLPQGYKPTEKEEYMNPQQLEYFRQKLLSWRKELLSESRETLEHLGAENWHQADIADRASLETEAGVELRTRNRYLKLISKIDAAITRIETGEYGYCEESGEPIGLKRLEARPVATLSIEAQERHEKMERQYTDEE